MDIPQRLNTFFINKGLADWPSLKALFVLRHDGQVLYRYPELKEDMSMGALVGGAWQAAVTLSRFIDEHIREEHFRLSFDTSDTGVYVLPVGYLQESLYIGLLYKEELNPAQLKNSLRILRNNLKSYLGELSVSVSPQNLHKKRLFENITDEEMNQLFSEAGA